MHSPRMNGLSRDDETVACASASANARLSFNEATLVAHITVGCIYLRICNLKSFILSSNSLYAESAT